MIAAVTPLTVTDVAPSSAVHGLVTFAPTAPDVIGSGCLKSKSVKLETTPVVVILPIDPGAATAASSELVNHNAPSRPAVMPTGTCILGAVQLDSLKAHQGACCRSPRRPDLLGNGRLDGSALQPASSHLAAGRRAGWATVGLHALRAPTHGSTSHGLAERPGVDCSGLFVKLSSLISSRRAQGREYPNYTPRHPQPPDLHLLGGGKGIRTPDLLTASQALYQLSYTPEAAQRHFFLRAIPVK
jgi:hypothetical protein